MNLQQRLHRIRYEGSLAPTLANLRALQKAALFSLPFENLDIHAGRPIAFTPEALDRKIVAEGRGGFCYELNSFFHDLLRDIGLRPRFAGARMFRDGQPGIPMGHMVLLVELDGSEWLVDVGNGKSCREPLDLAGSIESTAEGVRYRVGRIEDGPAVLETGPDGVIHWAEGVTRGAVIGLSIAEAAFGGEPGTDAAAAGAFRQRAEIVNARMSLEGTPDEAGEWRFSALPWFDPASGQFRGYRATARRPQHNETPYGRPEAEDREAETYVQATEAFSTKQWRPVAFTEDDVVAATASTLTVKG